MNNLQKQNSQIISRIIENKQGEKFQAWFLVTHISGKFFAKLIQLEKIDNNVFSQDEKILLQGIICKTCFEIEKEFNREVESPYVKSDFFLSSQMTRAPSLK